MSLLRKGVVATVTKGSAAAILMINGIVINRLLGVSGSGQYRLALDFCLLAGTIAGLGIGQAGIYVINNRRRPIGDVTATLIALGLAWCPIFSVLLSVVFWRNPRNYFGETPLDWITLLLLPASTAITIGANFIRPVLMAELRALHHGSVELITNIAQTLAALLFAAIGKMSVQTALITPFIGISFGLASVLWHVRRHLVRGVAPRREIASELISYGVQLATTNIASVVIMTAPSLLLGILIPPDDGRQFYEIGLIRAATGVCGLVSLIGDAATPLLYPAWAGQTDVAQRARQVELATRLYGLMGIAAAGLLALFARPLIVLLNSQEFVGATPMLQVLAFRTALQLIANVLYNLFPAIGRPMLGTAMFVATLVVSVVLNLLLIPRYGAMGSAVAMTLASVAYLAIAGWMARQLCGVRLSHCFIPRLQDIRRLAGTLLPRSAP